ncbi:2-iminobutanoate/2-iminopropanoate deaminase [Nocardioides zeae]|uniref:2-iminobutanoate/2-iminopropanoate deaminase n=1 Tax=Nocardioides zeae TaxID=1457234 RepID=A0ACC6IE11_9ACTN|nr:Rid family hydrolase [Nocardioides zeae]MDR6174209.1 2-iminobutanoate/2-iminopropanoate deaminase [Nocardioides zeae]MDR6209016.1 2-iminobutanoate/2-iminopropanoate deaminase [Nocardioides zeae]
MSDTTRRAIVTDTAPTPKYGYSQGIVAGGFLHVAGQVGIDPVTRETGATFEAKAERAIRNLEAIALAAGTSLEHAVRVGVFLEDLEKIVVLDPVYRSFFPEPRPARTTVQAFLRGHEIEIDAVFLMP